MSKITFDILVAKDCQGHQEKDGFGHPHDSF